MFFAIFTSLIFSSKAQNFQISKDALASSNQLLEGVEFATVKDSPVLQVDFTEEELFSLNIGRLSFNSDRIEIVSGNKRCFAEGTFN